MSSSRRRRRRKMRPSTARSAFWAVGLLTAAAGPIFAQGREGALSVTLVDETDRPIPGVTLTLQDSVKMEKTTDDEVRLLWGGLDCETYDLRAELPGLSPPTCPRIDIRNDRENSVYLTLRTSVSSCEVDNPPIDEGRAATGSDSRQDEEEMLPTGRNVESDVKSRHNQLTDGYDVAGDNTGRSTFVRPGSSSGDNKWDVDGLDVTDVGEAGSSLIYPVFDGLEEIQVITGGPDVVKRTPGLTFHLVTGRGRSRPAATAHLFSAGPEQAAPPAVASATGAAVAGNRLDRVEDYGLDLGFQAVEDHLWLWGAYSLRQVDRQVLGGGPVATELDGAIAKLTSQFSPRDSQALLFGRSRRRVDGGGAAPDRPLETTLDENEPADYWKLAHTQFYRRLRLTWLYAGIDRELSAFPKGGGAADVVRGEDGVWGGSFLRTVEDRGAREGRFDGEYLLPLRLYNKLRFGVGLRRTESTTSSSWPVPGVVSFRGFFVEPERQGLPPPGRTDVAFVTRDGNAAASTDYGGLWLQDVLRWRRLTFHLGGRFDRQEGRNDPSSTPASRLRPDLLPRVDFPGNDGGGFVWNDFSPRLGLTWALGESRRYLLRFGYSRFPAQLGQESILRLNPAAPAAAYFFFTDANGDGIAQRAELSPEPFLCHNCDLSDPSSLATPNLTDPRLAAAATREITVGFEGQLGGFLTGLTLTQRRVSGVAEERDLVLNSPTPRPATAADYVEDGVVTGVLPDDDETPYVVPVFRLRPALEPTGGTFLTNGEREQDYFGASLAFHRPLASGSWWWMLRGELAYHDYTWRIPAVYEAVSDPTDEVGSGDNDGAVVAEQARDRDGVWLNSRWSFTLSSILRVPDDRWWHFDLAFVLTGRQGFPNPLYEPVVAADGLLRDVAVADFDRFRNRTLLTADLRLERPIPLGRRVELAVILDAFNLTDETPVLQRERHQGISRANLANETLQPRVLRFGLRLRWRPPPREYRYQEVGDEEVIVVHDAG